MIDMIDVARYVTGSRDVSFAVSSDYSEFYHGVNPVDVLIVNSEFKTITCYAAKSITFLCGGNCNLISDKFVVKSIFKNKFKDCNWSLE